MMESMEWGQGRQEGTWRESVHPSVRADLRVGLETEMNSHQSRNQWRVQRQWIKVRVYSVLPRRSSRNLRIQLVYHRQPSSRSILCQSASQLMHWMTPWRSCRLSSAIRNKNRCIKKSSLSSSINQWLHYLIWASIWINASKSVSTNTMSHVKTRHSDTAISLEARGTLQIRILFVSFSILKS